MVSANAKMRMDFFRQAFHSTGIELLQSARQPLSYHGPLTYNDQRCPATKSVVIMVASGSALTGTALALAAFFGLAAAFFFGGMLDLLKTRTPSFSLFLSRLLLFCLYSDDFQVY